MAPRNTPAPSAGTGLATIDRSIVPGLAVDVSDVIGALAENLGTEGASVGDFRRIKMPAGGGIAWEVPTIDGDPDVRKELVGVIVYQRTPRTYFATSFEESEGGPPDCRSDDGVRGVGNPGGDCSACPLAQFGSGRGGVGQACTQQRQFFLLLEDGGAFPVILTLPPTSLKAARGYLVGLAERGIPFSGALTRIGLEKATNGAGVGYSRVTMTLAAVLDPEARSVAKAYAEQMKPLIDRARVDLDAAAAVDAFDQGAE